jgi:hypothetical protein
MEFTGACFNCTLESSLPPLIDPIRLDSQIYEFLLENKFTVLNDNGYL